VARAGDFLNHFLFQIVVLFNRIRSFFRHSASLHRARFAALHELSVLLTERFDETSLLLGVSRFNQVLRVLPTETRRELGNVLVVAPTRGGKGLLATSQLLTWKHSVKVFTVFADPRLLERTREASTTVFSEAERSRIQLMPISKIAGVG
jgi:hypothetical protein